MKTIKILVTGGPVHAHLDSVKIITNRFKGGRMVELASDLVIADDSVRITYLTSKGSIVPPEGSAPLIKVIYHNGFDDYRKKVLELAPKMDAVILGAAVCNLIPMKPWKNKFPSHNYKVGDRIPIDFTIAPRVVDEVKKVAPKTNLFAFKLLQGVKHKELIDAAYDIVLESKAVAVFANDANNLDTKYAVTKEGGVIEFNSEEDRWIHFILDIIEDKYYSSNVVTADDSFSNRECQEAQLLLFKILKKNNKKFVKTYGKNKYKFGTIAVRIGDTDAFLATARGKKEMQDTTIVKKVNHKCNKVYTVVKKATLNAPLLDKLFKKDKSLKAIVHYHHQSPNNVAWAPYAPSGTVRDTELADKLHPSHKTFQIQAHGTFKLLTKI